MPQKIAKSTADFDVIIVGAGLSGISAAYYLKNKSPWAKFKVLEARSSIGGTWDLFRYPGIRSDSDMFTLGYSFNPWKQKESIANGPSILEYLKSTVTKYNLYDDIDFNTKLCSADWNSFDNNWVLELQIGSKEESTVIRTKFLFFCSGYYDYDRGYLPDFKDIKKFNNTIVHPQFWPETLDYKDKQIVVIGSGATAVTLVPAMAQQAKHITMLQRSPTYIVSLPKIDPIANAIDLALPDSLSGPIIRWYKALVSQASYRISKIIPKQMAAVIKKQVKSQLPNDFDVEKHFTPKYNPWDQRLCVVPNGDLFYAIRKGKASIVTDEIDYFEKESIHLKSGQDLKADIVVTATGLELVFLGNTKITIDKVPLNHSNRMTFRGMMLQDVPNLAFSIGYTNASWTLKAELICNYTVRILNKMNSSGSQVVYPTIITSEATPEPLMGLSSNYILRANDRLPKQGAQYPWKVYQSYLKDYICTKLPNSINDKELIFSDRYDSSSESITKPSI